MIPLGNPEALYIDGEWIVPGEHDPVINPATEELIGHAPVAGRAEAERAIAAARAAFDKGPWRRMPVEERAARLSAMCDIFVRRGAEIRALITAEAGSVQPFTQSMQFQTGIDHARHYIERAKQLAMTALPIELVGMANGNTMLGAGAMVREPVGVVLAITPFNVPFNLNLTKSFAALATGKIGRAHV